MGKLRVPLGATGGKGFILAGPVGKTSPWEVNQSDGAPLLFFPVGFVGEVEDLDFDSVGELAFAGGEVVDGGLAGPGEDAGVAGGFVVPPFADHFEVFDGFGGADDADGVAGAGDGVAIPGPGVVLAVDVNEVVAGEVAPAFSDAIDEGFFELRGIGGGGFFVGATEGGEDGEAEEGGGEGRAG